VKTLLRVMLRDGFPAVRDRRLKSVKTLLRVMLRDGFPAVRDRRLSAPQPVGVAPPRQPQISARREHALEILGAWDMDCPPGSQYAWLRLPEPWRAADFAAAAERANVLVVPAGHFAVGRQEVEHGVRIGLGPPRTRADLKTGLIRLAELLRDGPGQSFSTIV
jgi:aspartate/methionine/tyrosine aminotransferase